MFKINSLLLITLSFLLQVFLSHSQSSYPEAYSVTGFPSQDQAIYGGWLTANSSTGSLLYYNLYSKDNTDINSTSSNKSIPLIIYLEGGPGDSAVVSAFTEIGPYIVASGDLAFFDLHLTRNPNSLTQSYHLLVIDQPVGTGFSIRGENDTVISSEQAAQNLITFFLRFYELYPNLQEIPTYFYGHEYGAKWVVSLLSEWIRVDEFNAVNVSGMILGNGLLDVVNQMRFAETAFAFGIINEKQRDYLLGQQEQILNLYYTGNWNIATQLFQNMGGYLQDLGQTGGVWRYNFASYADPHFMVPLEYLGFSYAKGMFSNSSSQIRTLLQIPENITYTDLNIDIRFPFQVSGDYLNSSVFLLEYVLDHGIDTLLYAGQFDGAVTYAGIMEYLGIVSWMGVSDSDFTTAPKRPFYVNDAVVGSYQNYSNLNFAVINKAGHFSIFDQGPSVLALLDLFINKNETVLYTSNI